VDGDAAHRTLIPVRGLPTVGATTQERTMPMIERRLLTVIAEAAVETRLIADVKRLGAKGHSIGHVRGEGRTVSQLQDLSGPSVRLETIVTDEVAEAILAHLAAEYFDRYAVIAWLSPVSVMRPERY
jgi:nitrogen regulatory protein P-II 2